MQESHSGILQVNDPGVLQTLQTVQLTMPSNGYFYTYLTNYSDQLVIFDNLTIRHKQGVLRAAYDYYPYGLPWDRVGSPDDETMAGTEFQTGEWGLEGLDLNYFAARYYDPILGRWHAPDPLEQCHSPYLAMLGDPANFIDPDGRAGIPFLQDFNDSFVGDFLECAAGASPGLGFVVLELLGPIGGTIANIVSIANSLYSAGSSVKNLAEFTSEGSTKTYARYDFSADFSMMKSSRHAGMAFDTGQESSSDPWHEENGMTVSDEGDNIYTLITYVESTFDTKIELNGNLWNNGNYQGQGMHSYQLYNSYKNYGGKDASLRAGEVRIPKDKICPQGSWVAPSKAFSFGSTLLSKTFEEGFKAGANADFVYGERGVTMAMMKENAVKYSNYATKVNKIGLGISTIDVMLTYMEYQYSDKSWGDVTKLTVNYGIMAVGSVRHPAAFPVSIGLTLSENAGAFNNVYMAADFAEKTGILIIPSNIGVSFLRIR